MQPQHSDSPTVAVLGLGIIGQAWAHNLEADGLRVQPWNRTPRDFGSRFARFSPQAARAVEGAQLIFLVVADPPAVEQVLEAIEPGLKPGQVLIQSSTISPEWTHRFAARVEPSGCKYLEAPFTGSKPAAEARQTVFYVGGDDETLEQARPTLERLSRSILHIGERGSASALKLAMNLNIAAIAQALCEGLTLCRKSGISDQVFFDALHLNVSRSGVSDLKEPRLREQSYAPQFSVKHMAKDLRLTLETAQQTGLELPQAQATRQVYERGIQAGLSEDDFIGLIRLLEAS